MTDATPQRLFSQVGAARYLGVSVRWFRDNVHVAPIAVGTVMADRKPLFRYTRESLDALVDQWAKERAS